ALGTFTPGEAMNEHSTLTGLAEQYKARWYDVKIHPGKEELPDFALRGGEIDAIARKGREVVLFQAKGPESDPEIMTASDPGLEYVESLSREAEKLVQAGTFRSALLMAWAAVEAAAREYFRRQGLDPVSLPPREIVSRLEKEGRAEKTAADTLFHCLR